MCFLQYEAFVNGLCLLLHLLLTSIAACTITLYNRQLIAPFCVGMYSNALSSCTCAAALRALRVLGDGNHLSKMPDEVMQTVDQLVMHPWQ
jgi:hypothetical protein